MSAWTPRTIVSLAAFALATLGLLSPLKSELGGAKPADELATSALMRSRNTIRETSVHRATGALAEEELARIRRRLVKAEVTRDIAKQARQMIDAHYRAPYGSEFPFESGGRKYVARIEEHYHPPGGEARPWGYHPGASVFAAD